MLFTFQRADSYSFRQIKSHLKQVCIIPSPRFSVGIHPDAGSPPEITESINASNFRTRDESEIGTNLRQHFCIETENDRQIGGKTAAK